MPYEIKDREHGWMNAIGLLFKRVTPEAAESIQDVIDQYGDNLYLEVQNGGHDDAAADRQVNVCPPGSEWDPVQKCCKFSGGGGSAPI